MSLFRRPKRRTQRRIAPEDEETAAEDAQPLPQPPPRLPAAPPRPLLSFADEVEEETETFRVKKSSHSKKLQRQKDRERRNRNEKEDTGHSNAEERHPPRVANGTFTAREDDDFSKNSRKNDNFTKTTHSIEGLVLSGRAALSAGATGDMTDSDGGGCSDNEDAHANSHFKPVFRQPNDSVRALLDRGVIPDAATIHAARKKRQQAREIGDFVPLQQNNSDSLKINHLSSSTINNANRREGRLVREDGAGDASDEDPDRIDVKGVAPETSRKERIKLAREEGPGSDPDSGGEEWETQQIRKAVTQNQIIAVQQETYYGGNYMMPTSIPYSDSELNPFSVTPSAIGLPSIIAEHLKPLAQTDGETFLTPSQLIEVFEQRLKILNEVKHLKRAELADMDIELEKLYETRQACIKRAPLIASRYEFYQKLRGYLTDLIECLDEKMPLLNALEARAMTLQKRKAAFLCERRRSDVRDQAHDVLQTAGGVAKKDPGNEERRRRCAEREGRRLRRRRAREQLAAGGAPVIHRDGDSSDDEVPQTELAAYETTQEQVLADADALFSDTLDEFSSLASVLSHLEDWKQKDHSAYVDAYVSLCLPRLAGPFLRLKLLLWNPITDETAPDWDKMQWYRGLMLYGLQENLNDSETEDLLASDPDICLIPNIVQKVILPKLTELIEGTWDPMSGAQSRRLASLLRRGGLLPGANPNSRPFTDLAKAVVIRVKVALQHDVFIPILPKSVVDPGPRGGCAFLKRQVAAGARLLNNLIAFYGVIADNTLAPLALEALLQRYLLAGIRCSPPVYSADICYTMATCLPRAWIEQERLKPPLQQFIVCCQEVLANLADNVLNLRAIEQVRSAIGVLQSSQSLRRD